MQVWGNAVMPLSRASLQNLHLKNGHKMHINAVYQKWRQQSSNFKKIIRISQELNRLTEEKRKKELDKNEDFRAILVAGMGKKMKAKKRQARKNWEVLFKS